MVSPIAQLAPLDPQVSAMFVADTAYDAAASDRLIEFLHARAARLRTDIEIATTRLANAEARVEATRGAHALLGRLVLEAQAAADHLVLTARPCAPPAREAPVAEDDCVVTVTTDTVGSGDGGRSFWWQILPAGGPPIDHETSPDPVARTAPPPLSERVRVLRLAPPSGIPLVAAHQQPVERATRRRTRWYARPFVRLFRLAA